MLAGMHCPPRPESAPRSPLRLRRGDGSLLELDGSRCALMAILNLTPDSFSDGGLYADAARALPRARELIAAGADILDIGAESTRPGAELLSVEEEWRRLAPVLEPLAGSRLNVVLSIDTRHAEIARRAAATGGPQGVRLLNLTFPQQLSQPCPELLELFDGVVVMHSRGTPATMRELTDYGEDLCQTVIDELRQTVASLGGAGASRMSLPLSLHERLIFDPGLGFAKTAEQSLLLLGRLRWLKEALGGRLLIGASRKSMLGAITGLPTSDRLVPSTVAAALAAYLGADVVRVHDVAETRAALRVAEALRRATGEAA
jgi:dihydropteroate synthase